MLKAYSLNPASDGRAFSAFPPPECEILRGCDFENAASLLIVLMMFLDESGIVTQWESDDELPYPDAWRALPQGPESEVACWRPALAAAIAAQLASYEYDRGAFAEFFLKHKFPPGFSRKPTDADFRVPDLVPAILEFLNESLSRGRDAEWLLIAAIVPPERRDIIGFGYP